MKNNFILSDIEVFSKLNRIRSFSLRRRKIKNNKKDVINTSWINFGINYEKNLINLKHIFNRTAPVILEIGFGDGQNIIESALYNPEKNFIGIEVYLPGVISCLSRIHSYNIKNIRIIYHDAIEVLENMIPKRSLSYICLFFPDPWKKKKHNKRRIIQSYFMKLIQKKLSINGIFHVSTDCSLYANHILNVVSTTELFKNISDTIYKNSYMKRLSPTKFEIRGKKMGSNILDLLFKVKD